MAPCWFHRIPPQSEQGPVPETDPFPFAVIEEMQSNRSVGHLSRTWNGWHVPVSLDRYSQMILVFQNKHTIKILSVCWKKFCNNHRPGITRVAMKPSRQNYLKEQAPWPFVRRRKKVQNLNSELLLCKAWKHSACLHQ